MGRLFLIRKPGQGPERVDLRRPPWLAARSPTYGLAQIPPADLDIPILGQLAPSQLPLGDAFEQTTTATSTRRSCVQP